MFHLINAYELGVEVLPVAGEDRLRQVDEVLQGADHSSFNEEVANVAHFVLVVPGNKMNQRYEALLSIVPDGFDRVDTSRSKISNVEIPKQNRKAFLPSKAMVEVTLS